MKNSDSSITTRQITQLKNGQKIKIDISPKDLQIANKHMKRCSRSLVMGGMQIKAPVGHHFTPTRVAGENASVGEGVEKSEPSHLAGESVKWQSLCGERFGTSSKS